MIKWVTILLLLSVPCSFGAVSVIQEKDGTGTTVTLTSNTTIGHQLGVIVSSATPTTVKIGSQTLSGVGQCMPVVASLKLCAFATTNITVASNSVTCTSCGSFNYMAAVEFSGASATEPIVGCFSGTSGQVCQTNNSASILGVQYAPGYSSEGILFGSTCAGSSTTPTTTGISGGGTSLPASNAVAWGVSSGTTLATMVPSSGCNQSNGIALAFQGSGATQQPAATPNQDDESAVKTTGNATVTATILNSGDLVILHPWCISTCGITTLTLGAQNATCPASAQGSTNASAGLPGLCYVITNTSGSLTVTFTPSGSPSQYQIGYQDFTVSNNTTAAFDKAAVQNCTSSCSEGTLVVLPSLTPTNTGSLLLSYVSTLNHATGPHTGSPQWSCYAYLASTAGSNDCLMTTTKNINTWILSSASGATTPNINILTSNDPYQSVIASFSLTGSAATVTPFRGMILGVFP